MISLVVVLTFMKEQSFLPACVNGTNTICSNAAFNVEMANQINGTGGPWRAPHLLQDRVLIPSCNAHNFGMTLRCWNLRHFDLQT